MPQQGRRAAPPTAGLAGPAPVVVLALGLAGFVAGVGLLHVGTGQGSAAFRATTGFAVWAGTIGAQTAYWLIVAGPLWRDLVQGWRRAEVGRAAAVALAVVLAVIVVGFPSLSLAREIPWPLEGHQWKIRLLTVVGGLLVAVPALAGVALVHERVRHRSGAPIDRAEVAVVLDARAEVLRFLSVAGAVIGLAILAAGALQRATVAGAFVPADRFPQEAVLLYGAFFTALLALVYVPAHLVLQRQAQRVRDHHFPLADMPAPDSAEAKAWLERRAAFGDLLAVDGSPLRQLEASLFIVTPLVSAILSSLVPG